MFANYTYAFLFVNITQTCFEEHLECQAVEDVMRINNYAEKIKPLTRGALCLGFRLLR